MNSTIISYRPLGSKSSVFLNVDALLLESNLARITRIYQDIQRSITHYTPEHAEVMIRIEGLLYNRIVHLGNREKERLADAHKGWKAKFLFVLTLGMRPLILYIKSYRVEKHIRQTNASHLTFTRSLEQMKGRGQKKTQHPELATITAWKAAQLDDLHQELQRLLSSSRIATSLAKVQSNRVWKATLSVSQQVAFCRSIALYESVKDTHYVINHGQNFDLMILNIVLRQLKKEFQPELYEDFEYLRADSSLQHIPESKTVDWYINYCQNDHLLRKELLCGDCVLESTALSESAIDFFAGQTNIANIGFGIRRDLLLKTIEEYFPDNRVSAKLYKDLVTIMEKYSSLEGNLYSILVPRKKFPESCYFSGPYGRASTEQEILMKDLEKMQSGTFYRRGGDNPQIRILTHKIRPEDGYHVVVHSTVARAQLIELEDSVTICIQKALVDR